MRSTWQSSVTPISATPPPRTVAIYTAVVGLEVEYSNLKVSADSKDLQVTAALEAPPEWSLDPWPPRMTGHASAATTYALAKLKALFDFAAELPNGHALDIRRAVYARFPLSEPKRAAPMAQLKRFRIDARIREDGRAHWGYDIPSVGDFPTGVQAGMQTSDLDIFLKNLIRADLQQRLEGAGIFDD